MLDEAPLLANASIRDFQGGTTGYVANAMEQALLLLEDMAELRDMRSCSASRDILPWYVLLLAHFSSLSSFFL